MEGEMYKVKFIALLFLRLKNGGVVSEFQLASNVDGTGVFRDVMVKYKTRVDQTEWKICLVQLKLNVAASFEVESFKKLDGEFSLEKYFKSYMEVKERIIAFQEPLFEGSIENCVFVLYTNSEMHSDSSGRYGTDNPSEIDIYFKSGSDTEVIFNFSETCVSLTDDKPTPHENIQFFTAFRIFTGEPLETQLDHMIKRELSEVTGVIKPDIDLLFTHYIDAMETWWVKGKTTLNQNSVMITKSLDLFKINTLSSHEIEQCHPYIKFLEEHYFDKDCLNEDGLLHIIAYKLCTKLTIRKVIQSMLAVDDEYILVTLESLLINTEATMSLWNSSKKHRLIILSESIDGHDDLCNTLFNNMQTHNAQSINKRIIVVSVYDDKFSSSLKKCLTTLECNTVEDNFGLNQLEHECRQVIDMRNVSFQRQITTLKQLLGKEIDLMHDVFNDDFIRNIFKDDNISIGPLLEETIPYYIPRTLIRCDILHKDVLREKANVFIVHGITLRDLQKLVPASENVDKVREINKCRYFSINSENGRNALLFYERKENVHELKMCSHGGLRWINTKGNIDVIKKYIDKTKSISSDPKTLMDFQSRIILVEALPGMGKSTLARHLAEETKRNHPLTWVVQIELGKHEDLIKSMNCIDGTEFLKSALGIGKQSTAERALFHHSLETQGNIVVILDGVDEIASKYMDKCLKLISSLKNTKVAKIIIITGRLMKDALERYLLTIAFTLLPFSGENQRDFFTKFWFHDNKIYNVLKDERQEVITKLFNDRSRQILETPLHAKMLAEIYVDLNKDVPDKLDLLTLFEQFIDKKFKIYVEKLIPIDQNIEGKMEEVRKAVNVNHMHAALVFLLDKNQLQSLHDYLDILETNEAFSKDVEYCLNETGIIDKFLNNKAIFIHRTFAEYFAALWFYQNYQKQENCNFLSDHMYTAEFKGVRRYFDLMLARQIELHTSVINNEIQKVKSLLSGDINRTDEGKRSALHLAAAIGFDFTVNPPCENHRDESHVVNLLLQNGADINVKDQIFGWTAIEYAIQCGSWDAAEILLEYSKNAQDKVLFKNIVQKNGTKVYNKLMGEYSYLGNQAAAYGYVNILQCLLSPHEMPIFNLCDDLNGTLMQESCCWNQISAVQVLVASLGENPDAVAKYVNLRGPDGNTSLHWASVQGSAQLLELLVSSGGNIWTGNKLRDTPLHIACSNDNVPAARALIASLGEDTPALTKYIKAQGYCSDTPLLLTSDRGNEELIELLISNGGDIWGRNKLGMTSLIVACSKNNVAAARALIASLRDDSEAVVRYINTPGHCGVSALDLVAAEGSSELVQLLISKRGDNWTRSKSGRTPLMIACDNNNIAAAQAIISSFGDDTDGLTKYINTQHTTGSSSLHSASVLGSANLIKLLISNGGDVWSRTFWEKTPLMVACDTNNVMAARALIASLGQDSDSVAKYVNLQGSIGYSSLHWASSSEVVELLIANGADVWVRNNSDSTPLIVACCNDNMPVVRALIASFGDNDSNALAEYINSLDSFGVSSLHRAASRRNSDMIELLISKGGDIWTRDKSECTPLISACDNDSMPVARALIGSLGEDLDAVAEYIDARDSYGCSSLHHASLYASLELLELLIRNGGDVLATNKVRKSPLNMASDNNKVSICRALIASVEEKDPNAVVKYIHAWDFGGDSALHRASDRGSAELVELLVSKGGDVWIRSKFGETPLMIACKRNKVSIAKAVIASVGDDSNVVAEYVNIQGPCGYSSLHIASVRGSAELVELLISKGGDIWARDEAEDTPLIVACDYNNTAATHVLIESLGDASNSVADYINARSSDDYTCLHWGSVRGCSELIELLVSNGGDISVRNNLEDTPLVIACDNNNVDAARALLESLGGDSNALSEYINARSHGDDTSLHRACVRGGKELVNLLVSKGGDIWARNKLGSTPLIVARDNKNVAAAKPIVASLGDDWDVVNKYICISDSRSKSAERWVLKRRIVELNE